MFRSVVANMNYFFYINFKILYRFVSENCKCVKYIYKAIFYNNNFSEKEYFYFETEQLYLKSKHLKVLECAAAAFINILNLIKYIANLARS